MFVSPVSLAGVMRVHVRNVTLPCKNMLAPSPPPPSLSLQKTGPITGGLLGRRSSPFPALQSHAHRVVIITDSFSSLVVFSRGPCNHSK